ncbi:MAG: LytR C-terminal domain-containing protein [Candidatus Marinimicrobia bacterium]|nr:LytR C-terminal domain-containing protein [Candidatus Neomarinimicrobiota bacterium]MBL7022853.1 LytR C-terminal domain-containing protein [Candidatus Neomarinimicrobiota bacterium]MBL7110047.1 LytR C-terminal domain-containing protein [Candidatus Neomarinimicrobiota bacterium]
MAKKKHKRQTRKKKKSTDFKGLFSNLLIFGLVVIVMGFVWSVINNWDSDKYSSFDPKTDLPTLITKTDYEKETGHKIKVEVFNGCGEENVASMFTDFFRTEGFDVLNSGNADHFGYPNTQVILRQGEREIAEEVAKSLKIDFPDIIIKKDPYLFIDVTIIIGNDWDNLDSFGDVIKFNPIF